MKTSTWLAVGAWVNAVALAWGLLLGYLVRDWMAATILAVFLVIAVGASAVASVRRPNVSRPIITRSDDRG